MKNKDKIGVMLTVGDRYTMLFSVITDPNIPLQNAPKNVKNAQNLIKLLSNLKNISQNSRIS
jgi:hypothetical protein